MFSKKTQELLYVVSKTSQWCSLLLTSVCFDLRNSHYCIFLFLFNIFFHAHVFLFIYLFFKQSWTNMSTFATAASL